MDFICPVCHGDCVQTDNGIHCEQCHKDFMLQALCPDCHKPLEVLKACGAVDYFCSNGHGLISKKRVEFIPVSE